MGEEHLNVPTSVHLIGGGLGATFGTLITCPLEVTKTRMQSAMFMSKMASTFNHTAMGEWQKAIHGPFGTRTIRGMLALSKYEGYRALYRGMGPSIAGVAPLRALHFSLYHFLKELVPPKYKTHPLAHLTAAAATGLTVVTLGCPLWVVKTRLQLQLKPVEGAASVEKSYANSYQCMKQIYREAGIPGFFRGLTASYWGVSEMTLQFFLYERFRRYVTNQTDGGFGDGVSISPTVLLFIASLSKLLASSATYPHEVIRTRLREPEFPEEHRGFFKAIKLVVRTEGWRALYNGMAVHLLRTVPNAAVLFVTYEGICQLYHSYASTEGKVHQYLHNNNKLK
eukprot:c12391_g1_i2.p1 GENE.c12391_g1_i2~~c12391_g1_i2.p1  ORF type:complete len:357 (+),score=132.05 c12391_g1_i2:55-1071(+)